MNDAVERVAEAIYKHFFTPDWPPKRAVDLGMDAESFRAAARLAIEALRPVPEICYEYYRCDKSWRDLNSTEVWNLWLDAALKDHDPDIAVLD